MKQYDLTQDKHDALVAELAELKTVIRPDILKRLDAARELGDLKENAEYHAMRDAQGKNESRIREIEEVLKFANVVEKSSDGLVGLASTVVVQKDGTGDKREFTIVGIAEADIIAGKVADNSPIGSALLGKKKGEVAEVETPKGITKYKIVEVK